MEKCGESPKRDAAILALLAATTVCEAAKMAGVHENTLYKWLGDERFSDQLRQARKHSFDLAISRLQSVAAEAVETLRDIMSDRDAPSSARVSAARCVLEMGLRKNELEDIVLRIERIEQLMRGDNPNGIANLPKPA